MSRLRLPGSAASDPLRWRKRLERLRRPAWLGTIRRTTPLSDHYGRDRGTPVDRYYIEQLLAAEHARITGRVLEVLNRDYTERFGTAVEQSDILDVDFENADATIVADLTAADAIPGGTFDCFILTQTLQLIYDPRSALIHARRILRPGGVLLATVPSITRVDREFRDIEYWRFTIASCTRLFGEAFSADHVAIRSYGNVLAASAFLYGMATEELSARELAIRDEYFPVIIAVRAVKTVSDTSVGARL